MTTPGDTAVRAGATMTELLLPRTDRGVVAQAVVLMLLLGAGWWATRRRPEFRLLLIGVGLVLVGLTGLRAAH